MKFWFSIILLLLSAFACCEDDSLNPALYKKKTAVVDMKNGDRLIGTIKFENDSVIVINTDNLGQLTLNRDFIAKKYYTDLNKPDHFVQTDPNLNSFLIAPTAECNLPGSFYISDYELIYLNFGYVPINDLHIGVGCFFPITREFFDESPKSIGVKYRFLDRPALDLAVMGSASTDHFNNNFTYGGALTYRIGEYDRCIINLYLGGIHSESDTYYYDDYDYEKRKITSDRLNYSAGISFQTGTNTKFMLEHFNLEKGENMNYLDDEFFNGLTLFGVRFFGENVSCDLAAVFGLENVLLPWVNVNYYLR